VLLNEMNAMLQTRLVREKSFGTFYVTACGSWHFSWKQRYKCTSVNRQPQKCNRGLLAFTHRCISVDAVSEYYTNDVTVYNFTMTFVIHDASQWSSYCSQCFTFDSQFVAKYIISSVHHRITVIVNILRWSICASLSYGVIVSEW